LQKDDSDRMERKPGLARVAIGLVLLLALAGAVVAGRVFWREQTLPVYTMGQRPPERNIGVNTLTRGSVVYVAGPDEFPFQPIWPAFAWGNRIGKTEGAGLYLYRPSGQIGDDYIYASGDMTGDMVYRDERIPPATLATLPISEIRLAQNVSGSPSKKTTRDAQVIREAVGALTDTAVKPVSFPLDDTRGALGYVLLLSDRLPGLGYYTDVHADDAGRVYLRMRGPDDNAWIPVGESFATWARP
jgi:hypothetical protein